MTTYTIISVFLGIGLAASVGFRVFLPLFALSLAAHFNLWELNESRNWIGTLPALITLGVAMFIEIFGYYIPFVDNLLDTIAIPLATIAGTAVVVSTVTDLNPLITWSLAIIAGGGTAGVIKSGSSATRLTSSATTGGVGNPVVSTAETGTSIMMSTASLFAPILAIVLVLLILLTVFWFYKKIRTSKS
jgi:hypothetical protein